ncbi:hypothetical protein E5676_scaffold119G001640 [Cucumis melo var. makuwa]|uniref:Gag protease polyprotein n=1 Tax=Cucumis melo var. makuwa TaxID=1194695 RepID=A0A5D3D510_CUCMM|nr:hypothetical protein E6C27_scaffold548G002180 [Cucumis melo var. makuwa]TYK18626.1 hypothetical protein E5676_scaffold119G001640 [Cucumis melo var. makuwa]
MKVRLLIVVPNHLVLATWEACDLTVGIRLSKSLGYLLAEPIRVVPTWVSFGITTYLGLYSPTGPPVWYGYRYDSSDSSDSTGSSQPDCLSVSSGFATDQYVLGAPSEHRRPDSVPTGAHVTHVEAGVRARASWRETRSDRKMPPRRGARRGGGRGGRGAGRGQPEEQPVEPAVGPNAPVTQADLAAMEHRYQDMLQATLAPFLAAQQN